MKHTDVILEISKQTKVSMEECNSIITTFEKYVEDNVFKSSKKHYDDISVSISKTTGIDGVTCKLVLNALHDTFNQGLKDKLTFKKR